jgi:arylsulfatase A-like enzyme
MAGGRFRAAVIRRGGWPQLLGLVLAVVLAFVASCRAPHAETDAPPAPPPPPFVVTVVVDQLAAWMADERFGQLPAGGGFARLRREGLYVKEMRYGHAVTDTAPGHAALYTGAVPRTNGIFANEMVRAPGAEPGSVLEDPDTRVLVPAVAGSFPQADDGSGASVSLRALRAETVADVLAFERPEARIYSVSIKDRGAVFGGGRWPTLTLWLDPARERFVTSTAYPGVVSAAVAEAIGPEAVRAARAQPWGLFDTAWVRAHAAGPDDQPGEGDYQGLGTTFPHAIRNAKALRATPMGDRLLLGAATAMIDEAAQERRPTLIAISFSSNDYVLHLYGPHSYEAWDELIRLDGVIADLLAALDQRLGPRGYALLLTGDHGGSALPELSRPGIWCDGGNHWERSCGERHRLIPREIAASIEGAVERELGTGPWVAGVAEPVVFLTPRGRALSAADRRRLVRAAGRALPVQEVIDVRAAAGSCPPLDDESIAALVCRSIDPTGAADLFLLPQKGDFFDPRYAEGRGTSHGSPYLYDRAVPLFVRAPGRVAAGSVVEQPVSFTAFSATAAALLGVRAPSGAAGEGRDLTSTTAARTERRGAD